MHTSKYEIYSEICYQHRYESQYAETVEEHRIPETTDRLSMQGCRVNQHGDECPYLFRVPSPISSPRYIGPYCSYEDSENQQEYGRIENYPTAVFKTADVTASVSAPMENFCGNTVQHHYGKQGIRNHDGHDMYAQKRR